MDSSSWIQHRFDALTAIDTVTNLAQLVRIDSKDSTHITRKFTQCWLTCYSWPQRCMHDSSGEFTGAEFQTLLQNCHIRDLCTTAKNPQSNAVCKRMHQTVGVVLRTLLHGLSPQNIANAKEYVDEALFTLLPYACYESRNTFYPGKQSQKSYIQQRHVP